MMNKLLVSQEVIRYDEGQMPTPLVMVMSPSCNVNFLRSQLSV
jgi:hypothetical protein